MKRVVRSLQSLTPRGFTLPEVLVTVAIIAVLSSAVVPTVVNQLSKGDTPALMTDLSSIRQAITNFTADTRAFPYTMSDLNSTITTTKKQLCSSHAAYAASEVSGWKGPYLQTKDSLYASGSAGAGHFKTASYNLSIPDTLTFLSGHIAVTIRTASDGALQPSDVSKLKTAIDGTTFDSTNTSGKTGLVRYSQSGSFGTSPVYILLVPMGGSC